MARLQAVIELLAGGLTDQQVSELEYALSFAFATHGYTDDGDTAGLAEPFLRDVMAVLQKEMLRALSEVRSSSTRSRALWGAASAAPGGGCSLLGRRSREEKLRWSRTT